MTTDSTTIPGIAVAIKPRYAAYVVAAWLATAYDHPRAAVLGGDT